MKSAIIVTLFAAALAAPRRSGFQRLAPRPRGMIVGGEDASPGEFPYQLSFQDTSYATPFHFCGASIYDTKTAICAGHCVKGENYNNPQNLQIVAGEYDMKKVDGTEQKRKLTKIVLHEDYSNLNNDISLLKIGTPFKFNKYVNSIDLPRKGQSFDGQTCTVTGWGTLSSGGSTPNILQKVDVPIVSDAECRKAYGESSIADSMICAGEGGKDSCQGDSGGPLACKGLLAGIVSWGYGCADPDYPGVYTEVSYFIDWIKENA